MKLTILVASLALASVSAAQQPPAATEVSGAQLALVTLPAKGSAKLTVATPAFKDGADIPFENTQYRGNNFPGLSWSAGPAGTESYVIIMQDADGTMRNSNGLPILHWTMANIPASVMKLDEAMMAPPAGATYGPNMRGPNQPYAGPRTPAGPKHRYHFQVFALDVVLADDALANYAALTAAMKDHVLASGEVVGLGQVAPPTGD